MKSKILMTVLILLFFMPLVLVMPAVRADEMFFVNFYVVDSHGTPLSGVEIEVTGIYNYDEFAYTGSDGHAARLALISDQRNAHYTWTAAYQGYTESGDFYVPDNYNDVDIEMSDVNAPTPTPSPTPTPTPPSLSPSSSPNQSPTTTPTSNPTGPTGNPTSNPAATQTPAPSASPNQSTSTSPSTNPSPSVPEFPSILAVAFLITVTLLGTIMLRKKQSKDRLKQQFF